ncbi:MAG: sugar phosphate isomerase/epimerase [Clostridia bacterium]|nr:sugar phosphate isomerase/epimerase [Clostridia bacterium]
MKLSQTNGSLLGLGLTEEESVGALAKAGFKCIDVSLFTRFFSGSPYWDDNSVDDIKKRYKEAFEKYGVTPVQSHEPAGNAIGDDGGEYFFKKTSRAVKIAGQLGCPSITIHPGSANGVKLSEDEFITRNVRSISRLIPLADEYNIDLLIENIGIPKDNYFVRNASELSNLVDAFNSNRVYANWDVGHAYLNGCDQYESIMALGKRLKGIHVHDNRGYFAASSRTDLHVIPYLGYIDFDSVMRGLIDVGYKGTMNFEVDLPTSRGESSGPLSKISVDDATLYNTLLYKIGERMLKTYGIYEY